MALHRDIHWIGRQWAVTGHGMQLIDQKRKGLYDIEVSRLWDEDLVERVRASGWLNTADFDKGLTLARKRYPLPPGAAAPRPRTPKASPVEPVVPPPVAKPRGSRRKPSPPAEPPQAPVAAAEKPLDPPKPSLPGFQMRFGGRARFIRPWRVMMKR